jgi:DNA replication protein DnaC
MIPANQLYKEIQERGIMTLAKRPLFIDELGREQLEINDFGNRIRPINDLMAARYETGARTFFTSNFKLETLSKGRSENGEIVGYGKYIGERIQEATNIVNLPGDSRREKWETTL